MAKINRDLLTQSSQPTVSSIEEPILLGIILWVYPLFFEFSPYRFRDIQMRRVWRQESDEQSPLLPERYSFHDTAGFMHAGVIQYQHSLLSDAEREILQISNNRIRSDVAFCHHTHILTLPVDKSRYIDSVGLLYRYMNVFAGKLPTVRYIPLRTYMRFISIIKVYLSCFTQALKFCNHLYLMIVVFLIGLVFGTGSYPFISSVNTFKKRRRVLSLIDFPRPASHSALAVCRRCRWDLIASNKSFRSSESRIDLRPCPGLLCSPDMPSCLNRFTRWFTLIWLMPVIRPTSFDVRPSAFNRITWQRLRKQWLSPFLNPCTKTDRSLSVSWGVFTRLMATKIQNNIK